MTATSTEAGVHTERQERKERKLQQQQQPGSTNSVHTGRRDNYNTYALAALMGYANVFNTSGIPMIWGKFQKSKDLADNRQELKKGMECWSRMKRITIEKAILFLKLT